MFYKNPRVPRKILKRRKNKLFSVISRFQILQSENQKKYLEDMTDGFYDISRDSKYGPLSSCFCQWKNYGKGYQRKRTGSTKGDHVLNSSLPWAGGWTKLSIFLGFNEILKNLSHGRTENNEKTESIFGSKKRWEKSSK